MLIRCPHCNYSREISEGKIPELATLATCPKCGKKFSFRKPPQDEKTITEDRPSSAEGQISDTRQGAYRGQNSSADHEMEQWEHSYPFQNINRPAIAEVCPWETARQGNYMRSFLITVRNILSVPKVFFQAMPKSGGLFKPSLFAVIVALIQIAFRLLWTYFNIDPQQEVQSLEAAIIAKMELSDYFIILLISVLLSLGLLYLQAGLLQMALRIFQVPINRFETTFRIVCYAYTLTLFASIPVVGYYIALICTLIYLAIACKNVYLSSYTRVLPAIFLSCTAIFGFYLCLILLAGAVNVGQMI